VNTTDYPAVGPLSCPPTVQCLIRSLLCRCRNPRPRPDSVQQHNAYLDTSYVLSAAPAICCCGNKVRVLIRVEQRAQN